MKNKDNFDAEINVINEQIKTFKTMSWIFVWIGVLAFVIGIFYWFVDENDFNEVGDFIGGVAGSLWALAGLFFIYIAFLGQRVEIKYQQEDLKLTRDELRETKEIFKQQSQIMNKQQVDNTFFNLLENHKKVADSLTYVVNRNEELQTLSGYESLGLIKDEWNKNFTVHSKIQKSKQIFNLKLESYDPKDLILKYADIEVLFDEINNILNFIKTRISLSDQTFYFKTLSNNLIPNEKWLIEAYNFIKNEHSLTYEFSSFESSIYYNLKISTPRIYLKLKEISVKQNKYLTTHYPIFKFDLSSLKKAKIILVEDNNPIYSLSLDRDFKGEAFDFIDNYQLIELNEFKKIINKEFGSINVILKFKIDKFWYNFNFLMQKENLHDGQHIYFSIKEFIGFDLNKGY